MFIRNMSMHASYQAACELGLNLNQLWSKYKQYRGIQDGLSLHEDGLQPYKWLGAFDDPFRDNTLQSAPFLPLPLVADAYEDNVDVLISSLIQNRA